MPKAGNRKYARGGEFYTKLRDDIRSFIKRGTDQAGTEEEFNQLALRLFTYQFHNNQPYQKYALKRGQTPEDVEDWKQIPAVPTTAFKEISLCTFPPDQAQLVFLSSGTTNPEKRSKVHLDETGVEFFKLSFLASVEAFFYTSPQEKFYPVSLAPSPDALPHDAAIIHGPGAVLGDHKKGEMEYYLTRKGLDSKGLVERLRRAEEEGEPVFFLGPTFAFVHFFDYCTENGLTFKLPEGSRLCDGAGYKGRSRVMDKKEFLRIAEKISGLPSHQIINNYSLSELQAVFPDNVLYNHLRGIKEPRYKMNPHWTRTVVVDSETLDPQPAGEKGLLRHYNLGNFNTVQAIQTDDVGYQIGRGFEVIGRAKGAEARGCSIAVDELISAQAS